MANIRQAFNLAMATAFNQTKHRPVGSQADFDRGLGCEWVGVKVSDMSKNELIRFIGQLDALVERMSHA